MHILDLRVYRAEISNSHIRAHHGKKRRDNENPDPQDPSEHLHGPLGFRRREKNKVAKTCTDRGRQEREEEAHGSISMTPSRHGDIEELEATSRCLQHRSEFSAAKHIHLRNVETPTSNHDPCIDNLH